MDKQLLELIKENPEKGMTALIRKYSGLVNTVVKNKIGNIGTSEDIEETVSDVFISFYNTIDSVDLSKGKLSAYLITIARRRAVDKIRATIKQKNETSLNNEDTFIEIEDDFNIESEVEKKLMLRKIIEKINALGEPDSTIIYQKYILCESTKSIAKNLNISEENIRVRLHRALKRIEEDMKGENYEN